MNDNILLARPEWDAEGKVCIEYTDSITGKVKEKISGKNYVYKNQIFGHDIRSLLESYADLYISEYSGPIDEDFPALKGKKIGYGNPNEAGAGAYKGSWRSSGSYRFKVQSDGIYNKYIYDFTPTQALGTAKTLALTASYRNFMQNIYGGIYFNRAAPTGGVNSLISVDGVTYRLTTWTSASRIISKLNFVLGTTETIDITAAVPYKTANPTMGYDPITKEFFIFQYVTSSVKWLYKISLDWTTSTEYSVNAESSISTGYAFGVKGNNLYIFNSDTVIRVFDYVNNIALSDIPLTKSPAISGYYSTNGSYLHFLGTKMSPSFALTSGSSKYYYPVLDLTTMEELGEISFAFTSVAREWQEIPITIYGGKTYCMANFASSNPPYIGTAITNYRLPDGAPARPEGSGMTIYYELNILF